MPPPRLSRLPPEPKASTFPFRSRGRGCCCTVRKEEEARNAAAAAAGRPAPRGRCPRGCSQALRGALGRGRRRLSSPSPEPGLASQRLNSQTSIMAAASEGRDLSAIAAQPRPASERVSCRSAQRVPPHHRPPVVPPPPRLRGEPERLRSPRKGRRCTGALGEGRTG